MIKMKIRTVGGVLCKAPLCLEILLDLLSNVPVEAFFKDIWGCRMRSEGGFRLLRLLVPPWPFELALLAVLWLLGNGALDSLMLRSLVGYDSWKNSPLASSHSRLPADIIFPSNQWSCKTILKNWSNWRTPQKGSFRSETGQRRRAERSNFEGSEAAVDKRPPRSCASS